MLDPELLTLREAAELLGITPDTLRAQVHRGKLTATKLGRDWLVRRTEVDRYHTARRRGRGPKANQRGRAEPLGAD